jgi:hypothetical protein
MKNRTAAAADDLVDVCRSIRLPRAAYRFYRALLLVFPEHGGPPERATLRRLARRFDVGLEATLALLVARDLVQRDPATGTITAAYPFSGIPTAHRVFLAATSDHPAVELFAMCAVDALGIPLMLRQAATITSVDGLTHEPVYVSVMPSASGTSSAPAAEPVEHGGWRAAWDPVEAVILARPEDHEHTHGLVAADSCCPIINFFCSLDHAERWAAAHADGEVHVYSQAQALRYAAILFAGVLDRLSHAPSSRAVGEKGH